MHIILSSESLQLSTPNRSQQLSQGHCVLTWRSNHGTEGVATVRFATVVNKRGLQNVGRLDVTMKDLHVLKQNAGRVSWCLSSVALGVWWCRCDRPQAASYATQIRSRHGKACQFGCHMKGMTVSRKFMRNCQSPNCEDLIQRGHKENLNLARGDMRKLGTNGEL